MIVEKRICSEKYITLAGIGEKKYIKFTQNYIIVLISDYPVCDQKYL